MESCSSSLPDSPLVHTVDSGYAARELELTGIFDELCHKYSIVIVTNPESFDIKSPAAIDVEHDEEGNLVGIGVYDGTSNLYFTAVNARLCDVLSGTELIAHNGKSDFELLQQWGIPVLDSQLTWDTCLIAHIIDSSRKAYGLKKLAREDLNIEYPDYSDIVGKQSSKVRRTLDQWPVDIVAKYNALDCFVTYKLWEKQGDTRNPYPGISDYFEDVEKPASYVFQAMENRGVRLDIKYLLSLKTDLEKQKAPIEAQIKAELGNINLNSPKQLLEALNAKEIFPELKGKPSTDKRALEHYRETLIVSRLLNYSELDTLLSSFVCPYLERNTEVVRPFFNQCGTRTGRPSCSNPNLLQIPRRTDNGKLVRRMFIPREGIVMGDCDFGQIEPRVLAHLSKDPAMCAMFNDGVDFHTFTSERLGITRDKAKVLNLSVGYRATFKSVMAQLGGTKDEAQQQITAWWSLFPGLRRWQELLIYESKRSNFCTTLLGRRIKVDGLTDGNPWKREAAERQLINNIAQGSAAEIMKRAMIAIARETGLSPSFGLLVQVYDELLFESTQIACDIEIVEECMENAVKLDVPLTVDSGIGPNWSEAH
jgi:DNA polymerase-1